MHEELKPYGVEVITVNLGAFRTGFNDTGMESMDQWWNLGERLTEHWPVRELNRQHDSAEMIEAIITQTRRFQGCPRWCSKATAAGLGSSGGSSPCALPLPTWAPPLRQNPVGLPRRQLQGAGF